MELVKFSGPDADVVRAAAKALQESSKEANRLKKQVDAAKEVLIRLLADKRSLIVDQLPDKTIVVIQADGKDAIEIKRKAQERFDQTEFGLMHPELQVKFMKSKPITYVDALVE